MLTFLIGLAECPENVQAAIESLEESLIDEIIETVIENVVVITYLWWSRLKADNDDTPLLHDDHVDDLSISRNEATCNTLTLYMQLRSDDPRSLAPPGQSSQLSNADIVRESSSYMRATSETRYIPVAYSPYPSPKPGRRRLYHRLIPATVQGVFEQMVSDDGDREQIEAMVDEASQRVLDRVITLVISDSIEGDELTYVELNEIIEEEVIEVTFKWFHGKKK